MMLDLRPYELFNVGGSDAPPGGIAEIVQFNPSEGYIEIKRPSADSLTEVMIVSGTGCKSGKRGTGFSPFDGGPFQICFDDADTPTMGDDWGTLKDSWELKKGNRGFVAWSVDGDFPIDGVHLFQVKVCNAG